MNWNLDFQNMEDYDETPRQSLNYDSLIGKGLLESPDEVKFISLPPQNAPHHHHNLDHHLDQFSSLRIRNKRKTMMGLVTRGGEEADFVAPAQQQPLTANNHNSDNAFDTMQLGTGRFNARNPLEFRSPSIMGGGADVLLSNYDSNSSPRKDLQRQLNNIGSVGAENFRKKQIDSDDAFDRVVNDLINNSSNGNQFKYD